MKKVNLGCGPSYKPGCINCDHSRAVKTDLLIDVKNDLPWEDGELDEVRCENLLDSLTHEEATQLIREIWRVLRPGGEWHFHQCDISLNPTDGFGWPYFVSGYTAQFFNHFIIGQGAYETWRDPWNLPGFRYGRIHPNDRGILIGFLIKP